MAQNYALQGRNFHKFGKIEYVLAKIKAKKVFLAKIFILFGLHSLVSNYAKQRQKCPVIILLQLPATTTTTIDKCILQLLKLMQLLQ